MTKKTNKTTETNTNSTEIDVEEADKIENIANLLEEYEENAKAIEKDKDEEGSTLRTFNNKFIKMVLLTLALSMAFYHVYALIFKLAIPLVLYSIHWGMGLVFVFTYYPMFKKEGFKKTSKVVDIIFIILTIIIVLYILKDPNALMYRAARSSSSKMDLTMGLIAIVVSLESARRTIGLGLPIVALVFVAYAFWGDYLPGLLQGKSYSFKRVIGFIFSVEGIFGAPIKMSAQYVFLLIIFGSFLGVSGTGEFFMTIAMKLAGKSRGGPAKVSIISSALFGSISGSAVANVVGTGVFTIPLMKKTGYKSHFAGAVEAVASTGGQIMPPIMGSGAFIMAELIGWSYSSIALGALIPALLYYFSLMCIVDLEAGRTNLKGVNTDDVASIKTLLSQEWNLLLPIIVLIYFLVIQRSTVSRSALYAIISSIIGCGIKKTTRLSIKQIIDAIEVGVIRSISIIAAVACAGVAIGAILLTGVGAKFAYIVVELAQGNLFLTLILSGIAATILGMGLPTVAAYIISASLLASGIIQLGVPVFVAHMFLLYYSILSQITPPVALAAYAAGNIAQANPNKVGFTAMRLGSIAFILPFFFVYGPALLLIGSPIEIIIATITASVGTYCLAIGIIGWVFGSSINVVQRIIILAAALFMIQPGVLTDMAGLTLILVFIVFHKGIRNRIFKSKIKVNS